MKNQSAAAPVVTAIATAIPRPLQLAGAFLLGIVILYGAALVDSPAVHNAAHDMRHSQGFPCH